MEGENISIGKKIVAASRNFETGSSGAAGRSFASPADDARAKVFPDTSDDATDFSISVDAECLAVDTKPQSGLPLPFLKSVYLERQVAKGTQDQSPRELGSSI